MIYLHVPTGSSDFILFLGCMISNLLLFQLFHFVFAGLEIAADTVANATNIISLATKNSGLVAKVATRF